jgi:glycosyltransferase involved in cell wall biosynthesis
VIVGGRPDQVDDVRAMVAAQGIEDRVTLCGLRPPGTIPASLAAADVLVSTRSTGSNTPLKLYAYLHSGRPIVATRITSHLQVLDDTTAMLVEPTPAAVAEGIDSLFADRELGASLGAAAALRGERDYSPRVFLERIAAAYAILGAPVPEMPDLDRVEADLAQVA